MRGGLRTNAGRKQLNKDELKICKQIYLSKNLEGKVEQLQIPGIKSFSAKAAELIDIGLSSYIKDDKESIRFADLFAGMGGIRLGFEQALKKRGLKGKAVFVSEIKKSAISVYKENFGNENIAGDITKINENDIPDIDYVLAGFPCQAFSNAGKRLGFDDTRGTLFFDVARIIKAKRPKGFLLENVEGLTTHDHGKTFKVITNVLQDLGYKLSYKVLNSADFGLAQNRKRIYIIGNRIRNIDLDHFREYPDVKLSNVIDSSVAPTQDQFVNKLLSHYSLEEVEGKQIKDKRGGKNNIHSWDFDLKGTVSKEQKDLLNLLLKQRRNKKWAQEWNIDWMDGMPLTEKMIKTFYDAPNLHELLEDLVKKGYLVFEYPKKKTSHGREYDTSKQKGYNIVTGKLSFKYNKILSPNELTPTLVATDMSHLGIPVNKGIRGMTLDEGLRLFGYPNNYHMKSVSQSKGYDLLGNTVAVNVIEAVAEKLIDVTEK